MNSFPFCFDIPNLDNLIDQSRLGDSRNANELPPWTLALVGPDGCGKSILALSLASSYLRRFSRDELGAKVVYLSTDLSIGKAKKLWTTFGLNTPSQRLRKVGEKYRHDVNNMYGVDHEATSTEEFEITQISLSGSGNQSKVFREAFSARNEKNFLYFDLQSETAGDGWHFANQLLGLLPRNRFPNLLVLDAVEGLETLVGEKDIFGEERDRRSRLAQLLRIASQCNVHVALVVEEPRAEYRLPEQYVVDSVIRLRNRICESYYQRTIEIEKLRSFAHARGEHELSIRTGRGTKTGIVPHLDDPEIEWPEPGTGYLAHIHVTHSLHKWNREVREETAALPMLRGSVTLPGLLSLNAMLSRKASRDEAREASISKGCMGLLIGNPGTHKGLVSQYFLANAFLKADGSTMPDFGVACLITTRLVDKDMLVTALSPLVNNVSFAERVLCRRLSVRHLSPSEFISIVETYLRAAQSLVGASGDITTRRSKSDCIYMVIEDWAQILSTYRPPNEGFLLQSIFSLLKREGVSTLIVSTSSGAPGAAGTDVSLHPMDTLDETRIYTWRVPFFGEHRVAITAYPNAEARHQPSVLELKSKPSIDGSDSPEVLIASEDFSLYADVEVGRPSRIPLVVRLYSGNHEAVEGDRSATEYSSFVRNSLSQVFPSLAEHEEPLEFEPYRNYDKLFLFADSLDTTRLDHALVLQVDEFWAAKRDAVYGDLDKYWNGCVALKRDQSWESTEADLFRNFRPLEVTSGTTPNMIPKITSRGCRSPNQLRRCDFFLTGCDAGLNGGKPYRLPFHWDFGLLIAPMDLWYRHKDERCIRWRIGDVWNCLCVPSARIDGFEKEKRIVPWHVFLAACKTISQKEKVTAFSCDGSTNQSLLSLVLEVWFSVDEMYSGCGQTPLSYPTEPMSNGFSLKSLLAQGRNSLFVALSSLASCLDLSNDTAASAASRQWYHTSSAIMKKAESDHRFELLSLPGRFSVRGDWYLSFATGSRSRLLAEHALDVLSSRRMNLLRLENGIGLPVRDIAPDQIVGDAFTAVTTWDEETKTRVPVKYNDLCELGAPPQHASRETFHRKWLWRSAISGYDRSAMYFDRWLQDMIHFRLNWLSYDESEGTSQVPDESSDEYKWFNNRLDRLIGSLRDG